MGFFHRLENDYAIVIGAAANVKSQAVGKKNTPITTFSVQYAYDKETEKGEYLNCVAWKDLSSNYLNRLDRGDMILCIGKLERDEYWSERNQKDEFKMTVEFAQVQQMFEDSFDSDEDLDLANI